MKILVLDDMAVRHNAFRADYGADNHTVISAFSYLEFLSKLDDSPWDLIYLDHDLGEFHTADTYVDGWGKTQEYNGYHAALRICELEDALLPSEVIIQSINPGGSRAMKLILDRRGVKVSWQPFTLTEVPTSEGE